jgi:hypothetical protein
MEHYWQECTRLPPRIQGWEAFKEMRDAIQEYLHVFPILHKLNSKVGLNITSNLLNTLPAITWLYNKVGLNITSNLLNTLPAITWLYNKRSVLCIKLMPNSLARWLYLMFFILCKVL